MKTRITLHNHENLNYMKTLCTKAYVMNYKYVYLFIYIYIYIYILYIYIHTVVESKVDLFLW